MRVIAKTLGLLTVAGLTACAQTAGLSTGLLGGDDEPKPQTVASTEGIELPGGPPMPARNERLRKAPAAAPQDGDEKKLGGLSLPRLSDVKLFTQTAYAPDTVEWDQGPVQVYSQLAQQIRACWLTPGSPKLPNHGFHATVADGDASEATIIIFQKDPTGGRGVQAVRIQISGSASSSTVKMESRRLDSKLDQTFKADIARWAKGKQECS